MKGKALVPLLLVWAFLILTLAALGPHPAFAQNRNIGVGPAPGEDRPVEPAWLYVVGINEYKYVQKLQTPVMDAQAVRDLLLAKYQFDRSRLQERYNGEATRAQILDDLYRLAKNLSPNDSLFIYYAGHGLEDPTLNQGFWIPVDAQMGKIYTYISNADIRTILAGIPANHVWLVSDSCFSGSLLAERSLTGEIDERYYREKYKQKSRQVMTSGGKEPVADQSGSRDCLNHSVFACYFLKYLQNNNQRYLTPSELFSSVAPVISNNSGQTPVFGPLRSAGDELGEFVLIARSTVSQPSPVALPAPTAPAGAPAPSYTGADTSNLQELEKRAGQREQDNKARQQQLGVEKKKYSTDLETYYQKVASLETRAALTPEEKAAAWADFLSKFPATHPNWGLNPRAQEAEQRQSHWIADLNSSKPAPTPSFQPENPENEIRNLLGRYARTQQEMNLEGHLQCYGSRVNWFSQDLSHSELRGKIAPVFSGFRSMNMQIDQVEIRVNGSSASAEFDKYWKYLGQGNRRDFCGKVRNRFELEQESGRWVVVGVKEKVVYWVEKKDCTSR
jgi:hypothetical protein